MIFFILPLYPKKNTVQPPWNYPGGVGPTQIVGESWFIVAMATRISTWCCQKECLGVLQPPAMGWSLSTALSWKLQFARKLPCLVKHTEKKTSVFFWVGFLPDSSYTKKTKKITFTKLRARQSQLLDWSHSLPESLWQSNPWHWDPASPTLGWNNTWFPVSAVVFFHHISNKRTNLHGKNTRNPKKNDRNYWCCSIPCLGVGFNPLENETMCF